MNTNTRSTTISFRFDEYPDNYNDATTHTNYHISYDEDDGELEICINTLTNTQPSRAQGCTRTIKFKPADYLPQDYDEAMADVYQQHSNANIAHLKAVLYYAYSGSLVEVADELSDFTDAVIIRLINNQQLAALYEVDNNGQVRAEGGDVAYLPGGQGHAAFDQRLTDLGGFEDVAMA